MFKTTKENQGESAVVQMSGTVDENTDFEKQILDLPRQAVFNCKKIDRINSAGVRLWLKYFRNLTTRGIRFKLVECSPAVVEQLSAIPGFASGGEVESIFVPFSCAGCKAQFAQLIGTAKLKTIYKALPSPNCPKCAKPAVFDEIEEEYFAFLSA